MGGCSIPEIRNSMPLINAPKQIPLGSELDVQCQVGYLNYNGEQQGTFACRPTSQGPKLCPKMGNCRDPMCIEGETMFPQFFFNESFNVIIDP